MGPRRTCSRILLVVITSRLLHPRRASHFSSLVTSAAGESISPVHDSFIKAISTHGLGTETSSWRHAIYRDGSYGLPLLIPNDQPFCVQRHIAISKSAPSTNVHYWFHVLRSPLVSAQAKERATGIAQKTVPLGCSSDSANPRPSYRRAAAHPGEGEPPNGPLR